MNKLKTRLGGWYKKMVKDRVVYQCSECGNVESEDKEYCSFCHAQMMFTRMVKEVENG